MVTRIQKGFSLIELLAVIAIVSVLAAILFPVFSTWKTHHLSRNVDEPNTRRIAMAILMYTNDNDEQFPRTTYGCRGHDDGIGEDDIIWAPGQKNQCGGDDWQDAVGPYAHSQSVFLAPGDHSVCTTGTWGGPCGTDFTTTDGNLSFLMNDLLSHRMPTTMPPQPTQGYADFANMDPRAAGLETSRVKTPSQCLMIAEGHGGWDKDGGNPPGVVVTDWTGSTDLENKWHHEYAIGGNWSFFMSTFGYDGLAAIRVGLPFYNNGGNVAYTDGHTAFVQYSNPDGTPVLCRTLPWARTMDPRQRSADKDGCNDPNNPPGTPDAEVGGQAPNWE